LRYNLFYFWRNYFMGVPLRQQLAVASNLIKQKMGGDKK
jgi:hypothetical protein